MIGRRFELSRRVLRVSFVILLLFYLFWGLGMRLGFVASRSGWRPLTVSGIFLGANLLALLYMSWFRRTHGRFVQTVKVFAFGLFTIGYVIAVVLFISTTWFPTPLR